MSWIALLLIGVGITDLVFSIRPMRTLPECFGAGTAVVFALLSGLTSLGDVIALVVIVAVVVAWGQGVTRGFATGGSAWIPLALLGLALFAGVVLSSQASPAAGAVQSWLPKAGLGFLHDLSPTSFLLLVGILLVQMSTGNVIVRLVLAATGTMSPARHAMPGDPETQLKGGRLLGPMERLFIVGLGLAGHLTAASIVIAAKGLLRFPELQSPKEQAQIHQLTEYFLVGSFVSWTISLTSLVLLR